MWKHRVKDFWVKEGDRNTRYFHKTTSGRWKNNRISGILNSYRVLVQDDALIEKCFINYFSNIFSFKGVNGLDAVFNLVHAMLSNNDIEQLDRPFEDEEIVVALKQMDPHKAPRPDGTNPNFFQKILGYH